VPRPLLSTSFQMHYSPPSSHYAPCSQSSCQRLSNIMIADGFQCSSRSLFCSQQTRLSAR
jgi:hypothetical protein